MCCLYGLIDYQGIWSRRQKTKLISVLGRECEERGTDASGLSFVREGELCIYKRPLPAHRLHCHIPKDSPIVMGHTRLTTQGTEQNNENNHPFPGKANGTAFALAHNGVIWNDARLRATECLPETKIETDSYVLVQLIEKQNTLDFNSLKLTAEKIEGSFSFTVLDQNNDLYFVKGDNPLCIFHFEGFYLYASTEAILTRALGRLHLLQIPHERIQLNYGDILRIDAKGRTDFSRFNTTQLDLWSNDRWLPFRYRKWNTGRTEYEEELINYAKCQGISPEKIALLLEYGYDYDTVEELLYEPSLLQSCLEELLCECSY